jgi:hypothetical protein
MEYFAIVTVGALAALVVWVRRLDGHSTNRGLEQLGLRTARQITEDREALEAEDLAQMLEATNARRRARGLPERSRADVEREFGSGAPR